MACDTVFQVYKYVFSNAKRGVVALRSNQNNKTMFAAPAFYTFSYITLKAHNN